MNRARAALTRAVNRALAEGSPIYVNQPIRPEDSLSLAGMDTADTDRETIRQITQAAELTAKMREPGRNIDARTGQMERESPLFFGSGRNPTLF